MDYGFSDDKDFAESKKHHDDALRAGSTPCFSKNLIYTFLAWVVVNSVSFAFVLLSFDLAFWVQASVLFDFVLLPSIGMWAISEIFSEVNFASIVWYAYSLASAAFSILLMYAGLRYRARRDKART